MFKRLKRKLKELKTRRFLAKYDLICEDCKQAVNYYTHSAICPHPKLTNENDNRNMKMKNG